MTNLSRTNFLFSVSILIVGLLGLFLFQSQPVAAKSWQAAPTATATPTPIRQIFISVAAQDGWIVESSENSNIGGSLENDKALTIGDNVQNKQYRSILSFNTSSIPDNASITHVMLKIMHGGVSDSLSGIMFKFKGFALDVKNGAFGLPALESSDFQAAASQSFNSPNPTLIHPCFYINLTQASASINKLSSNYGLTQIRLRFVLDDNNDHAINVMYLASSNYTDPPRRPQLIVTYQVP
jgi:hypothetical protein